MSSEPSIIEEKESKVATRLLKLNIGCGEAKLAGFVNIDIAENTAPDIVCDLRNAPLPFEDNSVELIHMIHNLEHIEKKYWIFIFLEFRRVLIDGGELRLAYPEFEVCSRYFNENYRGMRQFWGWCLYGRQLYPGDYHVVPMRTPEVINSLIGCGFNSIRSGPEPNEDHNTFLVAHKGELPINRELILRQEIFKR